MAEVIKRLIDELKKLPGIGEKTATRLTFHLLSSSEEYVERLGRYIIELKKKVKLCRECCNFSEKDLCSICSDMKRDRTVICVVEDVKDMMNIERTGKFKGVYHILHGVYSPADGITFESLKVKELIERVKRSNIKEVIIATNPTSEGNATAIYIKDKLEKLKKGVKITRIGFGIPVGAEIEYIDSLTLSQAIANRKFF